MDVRQKSGIYIYIYIFFGNIYIPGRTNKSCGIGLGAFFGRCASRTKINCVSLAEMNWYFESCFYLMLEGVFFYN